MKRIAWSFVLALAGAVSCAELACSQAPSEKLDLVLPRDARRIHIEITAGRESASASWNTFLERWLNYFDLDGDGALSRDEAGRVFSLPVPDGEGVRLDFIKADADRDAKVSLAELKTFYRSAGFTPVFGVVIPTSRENRQIANALFRHLGPSAGGELTAENFNRAASLLRKLDEDEDEALTTAEVLSLGADPALKVPKLADFRWAHPTKDWGPARIHVALDEAAKPMPRIESIGKSLRADLAASRLRVHHEQVVLEFAFSDSGPIKAVASSRQFVLAQFRSVAGKSASMEKRQVIDDPSLQVLADILPHADRDQTGRLTLAELERFLNLIELGVSCHLVVTLTDRGRNLFSHLDRNTDGRLDVQELNSASGLAASLGGAKDWTREQVPHYARITMQRGFTSGSFGPLPLAVPASVSRLPATPQSGKGPAWFQAMDKNGDGFLSPREFLGPAELFQKLNRNGDGLISIEEVEKIHAK